MTSYFIVVWWSLTSVGVLESGPFTEIFWSATQACNYADGLSKQAIRGVSVHKLTIATKDCRATAEPDFMKCLIDDTQFKLTPGKCRPKQEFIFGASE